MATNTILIRGGGTRIEPVANEVITPGQLLYRLSTGRHGKHNSAGGPAQRLFALEQDYIGKGIDNNYASGDRIHAIFATPGSIVNAQLASGQNVADGVPLVSDGAGALKAWTTSMTQQAIVGYSVEAVNASGALARIQCEVL